MAIIGKFGMTGGKWFDSSGVIYSESQLDENGMTDQDPLFERLNSNNFSQDLKLVASAPDMLEALIEEWGFIESYLGSNASRNDGFWYNEFLKRQNSIKVVIEKATGKSWSEIKELLGRE
jgi:hypothetical protein